MTKITDISQIKVGDSVIDTDGQISHIHSIIENKVEPVIILQHYPNKKWYIANVKCDKCSGEAKLRFTSLSAEKFICTHQIQVGEKFYSCGGKKYTEINRRHTGIACKGNHLWLDFIKQYQHVER
jgi:hypothetical protein